MSMYRGNRPPPGGNGRGQSRPNGAYPPMPGGPGGPATMPPGRFPPSDPYYRGGPGPTGPANGHANGHPADMPPYARNGSGSYPPYGPYRAPAMPPPMGARGRWSPPGGPMNAGYTNGHGQQHPNGPPQAPPVRRYSDSYPPNGYMPQGYGPNSYAPKARAEARSYAPAGGPSDGGRPPDNGAYGPRPHANVHYAPVAPSRW